MMTKKQKKMTKTTAVAGAAGGAVTIAVMVMLGQAPVDVRCALMIKGVIDRYEVFQTKCPPNPKGKPTYKWLPAPKAIPPVYDRKTQVLVGPAVKILKNRVKENYKVRRKTKKERRADADERKNRAFFRLRGLALKVFCDHENRILNLEGKTLLTAEECATKMRNYTK